jgi:hypothetical protein
MTANHRIVTEEIPKTWGPPLKFEKVFDGSSLVNVRVPFQPEMTGYMTSFPLLFCFYPFLICAFVMSLLSLI